MYKNKDKQWTYKNNDQKEITIEDLKNEKKTKHENDCRPNDRREMKGGK